MLLYNYWAVVCEEQVWWAEGVEGVKRASVQKARESTSWQAPVYTDGAALWINHKKFLSLSKLALLQERTWSSSPRSLSLALTTQNTSSGPGQMSLDGGRISSSSPSHAPWVPGKEQTDQRRGTIRTTLSLNVQKNKLKSEWESFTLYLCCWVYFPQVIQRSCQQTHSRQWTLLLWLLEQSIEGAMKSRCLQWNRILLAIHYS